MINKQTFKFSSYNNNIQLINPNLENNDKQEMISCMICWFNLNGVENYQTLLNIMLLVFSYYYHSHTCLKTIN